MSEKKYFVREKFSNIHENYDFLNSLLSFGIDKYWRRYVVSLLDVISEENNAFVLDLCAGTMPLSVEIGNRYPKSYILSVDFCQEMLFYGLEKNVGNSKNIIPLCGDALQLPFMTEVFTAVTVAFGVRNFSDIKRGICEIKRVLKKGGKIVILEFSHPKNIIFNVFYRFYLYNILPNLAGFISGDREAYRYLATSISSFYGADELKELLEENGFERCGYRSLTMGIVCIHWGYKV